MRSEPVEQMDHTARPTRDSLVTVRVDHRQLSVPEGSNLLQVCLTHGIYVPNLCYLEGMDAPQASCRLCFVEIEGRQDPVASCTVAVWDAMVVKTDTPAVRALQKTALRLLLSAHRLECAKCPANRRCELQRIAAFLKVGLKPKGLDQHLKSPEEPEEHPCFDYHPNRCVLCGKCILVCERRHGQALMAFARRGIQTVISFYPLQEDASLTCSGCTACADICPVAAITPKNGRIRINDG